MRLASIGIALVGLGIAAYLTIVHYAGGSPVCAIAHGCETVQHSSYAKLGGVPVALLGMLGYVGILASLWRDDEGIARVFAPCGLDIGAATVEETAVAVLAEIIAHRAGRDGGPLRETSGPIRRRRAETTA